MKLPLLFLAALLLITTAAGQTGDITQTEDNCFDFAMRYAEEQNQKGENWGVVVEYYLPWSQEQTHYHAYQLEGDDLHIHGLYKNRMGEWHEYDFLLRQDWYKQAVDTGEFATNSYLHFWTDPSTAVRNVASKKQIRDNRSMFGLDEVAA